MATDYDAPRSGAIDTADDNPALFRDARPDVRSALADVEGTGEGDSYLGPEHLDEELAIAVVPMRADEFRCGRCFLVKHRSQLSGRHTSDVICRECD